MFDLYCFIYLYICNFCTQKHCFSRFFVALTFAYKSQAVPHYDASKPGKCCTRTYGIV